MGKISLVRLDEFDSLEGCLYSVASDDCENTLFDNFINENHTCPVKMPEQF